MIRVLLALLAVTIAYGAADAQPARGKVPRVGILSTAPVPADLRKALRDQGYVEGRTILFESRPAAGPAWFADLAAQLVDLDVDVIFASSTSAAHAARAATRSIPIVATLGVDPVAEGLVASLARPGGNLTGVSGSVVELNAKLLELLTEAVPSATRVGALILPDTPAREVGDLEAAARALGIGLQRIVVPAMEELELVLRTAVQNRVGAPGGSHRPAVPEVSAARHLLATVVRRGRWAARLRTEPRRDDDAGRRARGEDPQGRPARRSAGRAGDPARLRGQPQDGRRPGPGHSAGRAAPGHGRDSVTPA